MGFVNSSQAKTLSVRSVLSVQKIILSKAYLMLIAPAFPGTPGSTDLFLSPTPAVSIERRSDEQRLVTILRCYQP
jgi:hypothetical protein